MVWAYARTVRYPSWPYRGAELVAQIFDGTGIDGVRGLIGRFRSDPAGAAAELDGVVHMRR